jgi:hypothetical protein
MQDTCRDVKAADWGVAASAAAAAAVAAANMQQLL